MGTFVKFKIFYGGVNTGMADVQANAWIEQHPNAEILDFKYQHVESDDVSITSICIAYKEFP